MKKLRLVPALLTAVALGACTDQLLNVLPVDEISEDIAIIDARSATAALMGAYSALESGSLYGGDYFLWTEVLTDNVEHTGTFGGYADGDQLNLRPQNGIFDGMWTDLYDGINRTNLLIQKVPDIQDLDATEANQLLGQAYGLRALFYFDLVRAWGDVPLVLTPAANLDEAAQVSRDPASAVYTQIEADLSQARTLLSGVSNDDRTFITPGGVTALEARVALFQGNWATAATKAEQLVNSGEYALVTDLRRAFTADGDATEEDIFRVAFTPVEWNNQGYYYLYDGRFEIGATQAIYDLFEAGDLRFDLNFSEVRPDGIQVTKFPTPIGAEDIHVIRYADVLLILAEALAEQGGDLSTAVGYMNQVRTRAGLTGYDFGTDLVTKQEVLDAIFLERRLELAFEGEYWFDLVRTGRAAAALGPNFEAYKALWPIPQGEMDTAPLLVQNPGYGN
jgi:hypothetical protein